MSEQIKVNAKKKTGILVALAVVATLVLAPIGSYFYLRKGLEYRLESLDQLQEKKVSPEILSLVERSAPFNGNARLIHFPSNQVEAEIDLLISVDDQIVDRARFEIISFSNALKSAEEQNINFVGTTETTTEMQFMMIDTSNVVRSTYIYNENLGKEIIRHLSVLVPVPTSRSVTLQREDK